MTRWHLTLLFGALAGCSVPGAGMNTSDLTAAPADEAEEADDAAPAADTGRFWGGEDTAAPSPTTTPDPDVEAPEEEPTEPTANMGIPAATCLDARLMDPLQPGVYQGSLDGYANAGLAPSCLPYGSYGQTGFYKVEMHPGETLTARWFSQNADGQLFLMGDCDIAGTCVAGADTAYVGDVEVLTFTHTGLNPAELFLAVANYAFPSSASFCQLELDIR